MNLLSSKKYWNKYIYICVYLFSLPSAYAEGMVSPDGRTNYVCENDEALSPDGCRKFWCAYYKGELPNNTLESIWSPCFVNMYDEPNAEWQGIADDGGVPWWYWKKGTLNSEKLEGLVMRDYQGPNNETSFGDVVSIPGKPGCYRNTVSKNTICMVPMR